MESTTEYNTPTQKTVLDDVMNVKKMMGQCVPFSTGPFLRRQRGCEISRIFRLINSADDAAVSWLPRPALSEVGRGSYEQLILADLSTNLGRKINHTEDLNSEHLNSGTIQEIDFFFIFF